jgi:hypothetical protein
MARLAALTLAVVIAGCGVAAPALAIAPPPMGRP